MASRMLVSLIISTCGRTTPLERLFSSLAAQTHTEFEVILVDQNKDERLTDFLADREAKFPIRHIRTPDEVGLSQGRNSGLASASGTIVVCPDDDCWYPPHFLAHGIARMREVGADILSGRAANEDGFDINGRFEQRFCRIERANVWTTGIEWVVFFTKRSLDIVGAYDPEIGIGARTPWQSCEGQDVMLRALKHGLKCFYDPSVYGHHEEHVLARADAILCRKGRAYGRGLGHVLRIHGYSGFDAGKWIGRATLRSLQSLALGRFDQSRYYRNVALGRYEGWSDTARM